METKIEENQINEINAIYIKEEHFNFDEEEVEGVIQNEDENSNVNEYDEIDTKTKVQPGVSDNSNKVHDFNEEFFEAQLKEESSDEEDVDASYEVEDDVISKRIVVREDCVINESGDEDFVGSDGNDHTEMSSGCQTKLKFEADDYAVKSENVTTVLVLPQNRNKSKEPEFKLFTCQNCRTSSDEQDSEEAKTKPYKCDVCFKRFITRAKYNMHLRKHYYDRNFECVVCHKKFIRKINFQESREKSKTPPPTVKFKLGIYGCNVCEKHFRSRSGLTNHLKVHINDTVCSFCGKSFGSKEEIKRHLKSHRNYQFKCDECDVYFSSHLSLKEHKTIHTGEKPYTCDTCFKSFRVKRFLRDHLLIHQNNRPIYSCGICKKPFKNVSTLQAHMNTRHCI